MSMYADYIREKTTDSIYEDKRGFATYRYLDDGKTVYIIDLYIDPDFRQTGEASTIADIIVEEARKKGCSQLLGSVVPSNKNSTMSIKVLLGYGMSLSASNQDFIWFRKDI